jgi:hypothetical protein
VVEKQKLPVKGQSHWCDGMTADYHSCLQVVPNTSDHCGTGHPNFLRTLLTAESTPHDLSTSKPEVGAERPLILDTIERFRTFQANTHLEWLCDLQPGDYAASVEFDGSGIVEVVAVSDDEIVTKSSPSSGLTRWPRDGVSDGPLTYGQFARHLSKPDPGRIESYLHRHLALGIEKAVRGMSVEQLRFTARAVAAIVTNTAKSGSDTLSESMCPRCHWPNGRHGVGCFLSAGTRRRTEQHLVASPPSLPAGTKTLILGARRIAIVQGDPDLALLTFDLPKIWAYECDGPNGMRFTAPELDELRTKVEAHYGRPASLVITDN